MPFEKLLFGFELSNFVPLGGAIKSVKCDSSNKDEEIERVAFDVAPSNATHYMVHGEKDYHLNCESGVIVNISYFRKKN